MFQQIPAEVRTVLQRLQEAGHSAFLVGGSVRDMLRGEPPKDFDVATSARPEQVQRLFRKTIPTGIEHGTVTVLSGSLALEVTTFRTEGAYEDGRRPTEVRFEDDIEQDLSRRDFTINAIAYDPISGGLRDPFDGQRDLAARRVRTVGEPAHRFGEDGLRPLRAVRFATVLDFQLDPATESAIPATLEVFRKVAAERVREELGKILLSPRVAWGLEVLDRVGLLAEILPEVTQVRSEPSSSSWARVAAVPGEWLPRLTALLLPTAPVSADFDPELKAPLADPRAARRAMDRLRLPARLMSDVETLLRLHPVTLRSEPTPVQARRLAARAGLKRLPALAAVSRAAPPIEVPGTPMSADSWPKLIDQIIADPPPLAVDRLALDGAAVMRFLGVKPSPVVGEALRFLLNEVLENPGLNEPRILEEKLLLWAQARER